MREQTGCWSLRQLAPCDTVNFEPGAHRRWWSRARSPCRPASSPVRRSAGVDPTLWLSAQGMSEAGQQSNANEKRGKARITSRFAYPKVEASLLSLRLSSRVPEPRLHGPSGTTLDPNWRIQESPLN